ncbi:hypothetical protein [Bacterioplanoides sp. SCSIO 12839]|uniref:hypothetical protein n=1 Tax=Bacterioplanoides sp. SCSIO 12839 TaxID=2829569 RepID=UPI0021041397|nr:hypothetical protein [Bacterioplanoides sp. SCSIO 12839]UTW49576.1 hypothetical protein KFF03_06720 [Bacterioplanoides sp. SCSIO 12839]
MLFLLILLCNVANARDCSLEVEFKKLVELSYDIPGGGVDNIFAIKYIGHGGNDSEILSKKYVAGVVWRSLATMAAIKRFGNVEGSRCYGDKGILEIYVDHHYVDVNFILAQFYFDNGRWKLVAVTTEYLD